MRVKFPEPRITDPQFKFDCVFVCGQGWKRNKMDLGPTPKILGVLRGGEIVANMAGQQGLYALSNRNRTVCSLSKTDPEGLAATLNGHAKDKWDTILFFGIRTVMPGGSLGRMYKRIPSKQLNALLLASLLSLHVCEFCALDRTTCKVVYYDQFPA